MVGVMIIMMILNILNIVVEDWMTGHLHDHDDW